MKRACLGFKAKKALLERAIWMDRDTVKSTSWKPLMNKHAAKLSKCLYMSQQPLL